MRSSTQPVVWRQGVHIRETILWCDALRARDLCFLSHGAVAVRGGHRQVLLTSRTLELLAARKNGGFAWEPLITPFGRRFTLGALRLELFPSGRLPGAASLLVVTKAGPIVYGGEVNPSAPGGLRLAEPCEVRGAETLIVAAPLAPLARPLPPRQDAEAALLAAVGRALDDRTWPIILAPAWGAAEEAILLLTRAGFRLSVHPRLAAHLEAYRRLGLDVPRPSTHPRLGTPLVWPLELRHSPQLARLERARRIAAAGVGLDPRAPQLLGVDEVVPLADHADLDALLEYVRTTGARRVYFTTGYCEAVARALAKRHVEALPLGPPEQMKLL